MLDLVWPHSGSCITSSAQHPPPPTATPPTTTTRFDHTRGIKFSTHAFNWIRQAMMRGAMMESAVIR